VRIVSRLVAGDGDEDRRPDLDAAGRGQGGVVGGKAGDVGGLFEQRKVRGDGAAEFVGPGPVLGVADFPGQGGDLRRRGRWAGRVRRLGPGAAGGDEQQGEEEQKWRVLAFRRKRKFFTNFFDEGQFAALEDVGGGIGIVAVEADEAGLFGFGGDGAADEEAGVAGAEETGLAGATVFLAALCSSR